MTDLTILKDVQTIAKELRLLNGFVLEEVQLQRLNVNYVEMAKEKLMKLVTMA